MLVVVPAAGLCVGWQLFLGMILVISVPINQNIGGYPNNTQQRHKLCALLHHLHLRPSHTKRRQK